MDTKITVAIVGAAATIVAAVITAVTTRRRAAKSTPDDEQAEPKQPLQSQSGLGNLQAGRDISIGRDFTVVHQSERTEGVLEITSVGFTRESEFDVLVRNVGDTDLIIHTIAIKKVEDPDSFVLPILNPTAKYVIPVNEIPVGGSQSLSVSHVVPARSADRFLIALDTTRIYLLEVILHYNKDKQVSFQEQTWLPQNHPLFERWRDERKRTAY